MGTKIQANSYLRDYHPIIDLDGNTNNGLRSVYRENQMARNGLNLNSFVPQICESSCFGYETDKVRQTILEQETIFRNQLQELHRLYRRQQELMIEVKRREVRKDDMKEDLSKPCSLPYVSSNIEKSMQERFSKLPVFETTYQNRNYHSPYERDSNSRFGFQFKNTNTRSYPSIANPTDGGVSANSCSNLNLVTKDLMQDFSSDKKPAEPRNEFLNFPLDLGASISRRKRKIFGVEICEGSNDTFEMATNMSSTRAEKYEADLLSILADRKGKWLMGSSSTGVNYSQVPYQSAESQTKQENPKGGLPWFLKNSQYNGQTSNGTKSSYFMNMESLRNCSENFFAKQKKGTSATNEINVNDGTSGKKILGFPIPDHMLIKDLNSRDDLSKPFSSNIEEGDSATTVKTDEDGETKDILLQKGLNNCISDSKHRIDLNLTLDEEDVPLTPSVPSAILKIASIEIDLEAAPAVNEPEAYILPKESNSFVSCEDESAKIAAEVIIAISLFQEKKSVNEPQNSESTDLLKCLAEIISSQCENNDKEESTPIGMDDFEFMTLKLEDTKEKYYHYKPFTLHVPSDEEVGGAKLSKRSRSRRGCRQKRDFQRDVLPGLVTLSRHQVTEDFQAFEEMLKAGGSSTGQSGFSYMRNGRGRKRLGGTTVKAHCSAPLKQQQQKQQKKPVSQNEGRSLTGWGKRTRRLPRQRYANSFLSFPVKC